MLPLSLFSIVGEDQVHGLGNQLALCSDYSSITPYLSDLKQVA